MADMQMGTTLPRLPERFQLTPEFRLVAACSWVAPESLAQAQADKIVELCNGHINWDLFIALIKRHEVHALAHASLSRHAGNGIPLPALETIRKHNSIVRRQSLFQTAELIRLIRLFSDSGVEVIPLKGVFLSQQIHGDPGMRSSVDLDILVKPEQVDLAEQVLETAGYYCEFNNCAMTAVQKAHTRNHIHHMEFAHCKSGLHVELHWSLGPWLPEQVAVIWDHMTQAKWQGVSINSLDNEALLLVLCDHGARHEWSNLKWLGDIAQLLTSERITDWERLLSLARQLDLLRTLAHGVLLVHWLLDIQLPEELRKLIRKEKQASSLSEKALPIMLMSAKELVGAGKRARSLKIAWKLKKLRPSLPYGVILKTVMVPLIDCQTIPLPAALFWLYYPLRPVLWFWRHYVKGHKQP